MLTDRIIVILQVSRFPEGTWLMFTNITELHTIFSADTHIPLDCKFLVAHVSEGEEGSIDISLTEVYHIHPTRSLQEFRVANWTSSSGVLWFATQQRRHLQGIKIKAGFREQVTSLTTKSSWTIRWVSKGKGILVTGHGGP
jgi:hypothetical protein